MSIATELQNYADGLDDAYDAVNDMSGIIPQHKNMNNLDQAIRTIPQNTGITATTFHWGGSPNYSMYKDSGYTTAATYSDIATAYAGGLVYIADGEDEVTYVVVSDIPDAYTITVTGIGLPGYEGGSTSYTYASSTWTKTATEFQKKLTAGTNIQINGTTISATDTTYSDMVGATSLDAGTHGLVPAPAAGDENKVLSGAGTWVAQTAAQVNSDWNSNSGVSQILNKPSLAAVATSGDYGDLLNKPTIPAAQVNSDWDAASGVAQILNKPSLATVATSGDYGDLLNKPTIPAAQIQSDWTQSDNTKLDYIKNKPTIPTVNDATLTIQKNGSTVKTFTANASSDVTANISVPTQFSDLSGTVGSSQFADNTIASSRIKDGEGWVLLGSAKTTAAITNAQVLSVTIPAGWRATSLKAECMLELNTGGSGGWIDMRAYNTSGTLIKTTVNTLICAGGGISGYGYEGVNYIASTDDAGAHHCTIMDAVSYRPSGAGFYRSWFGRCGWGWGIRETSALAQNANDIGSIRVFTGGVAKAGAWLKVWGRKD